MAKNNPPPSSTTKNIGSYYRRPSAAIEGGGGFFVPGLEGFRCVRKYFVLGSKLAPTGIVKSVLIYACAATVLQRNDTRAYPEPTCYRWRTVQNDDEPSAAAAAVEDSKRGMLNKEKSLPACLLPYMLRRFCHDLCLCFSPFVVCC